MENNQQYDQQQFNAEAYKQPVAAPAEKKETTNDLIAMILGIISLALYVTGVTGVVTPAAGIVAIVMAITSKSKNGGVLSDKAKTGLIMGIVSTALTLISGIITLLFSVLFVLLYFFVVAMASLAASGGVMY